MYLLLLFLTAVAPNVQRLGDDDWRVREAETERCDNLLSAVLLPASSEDAEVNFRVQMLRKKHLGRLAPLYLERRLFLEDFAKWMDDYFVSGRSRQNPYDLFVEINSDATMFYAVLWKLDAFGEASEDGGPSVAFCVNWPGEFDRWLDFVEFHTFTAPMPRSK